MFIFKRPLTIHERAAVKANLGHPFYFRFGGPKRYIDVGFIPDGAVTDLVVITRSDGAMADSSIPHGDENAMVSVLEQLKACAEQWLHGDN